MAFLRANHLNLGIVNIITNINILISIQRRGPQRFRPELHGDARSPDHSIDRKFEFLENVCIGISVDSEHSQKFLWAIRAYYTT